MRFTCSQLTNWMPIRLTIYEPDVRLSGSHFLIKEGYLDNFNKSSCGIKILYGGAGRRYGGGGRICHQSVIGQSIEPLFNHKKAQ